jgi:glycosyltransferase involved in cell wall biosynthesis
MRVHQMTATLKYGDAVSNDVFEIDHRLKAWGLDARIYAEHIDARVATLCRPDTEYAQFLDETADLLIYHYSIYVPNLALYKRSRSRKIVIYHNITPPEYFHAIDSGLESLCRTGRLMMGELRGCELALADSDFNRCELVAAGLPEESTGVLPIFLSLDKFASSQRDAGLYRQVRRVGQVNLLYVGRLAPNKGCDDLIKVLYTYRKHVHPDAHLWLVGDRSLVVYVQYLEGLVTRLGLHDAVTFTDRVSLNALRTYYEASDLLLYASRHEGFGVPLVESMHFGLPILAYNATVVPETLGDCGVLFDRLAFPEVAEMIHLLVTDQDFRRSIIAGQRRRLVDFAPARVETQLRQVLERVGIL